MIRRSRRQRERPNPRPRREWEVHNGLARARDRHRHLFHASLLALLAAVAGWLLGLDLTIRAIVVVVAGTLAWLVPLRGSNEWALDWIGDRAGLAYQTALEMEEGNDPYGLRAAVEARANASLAQVERPEHSAWWLPLMALALGALLLPALPLGGGAGPVGGPQPPGAGGPSPAAAEEAREEAEEPTPNLPGDETARVARTPGGGAGNDERGEEGEAAGEGQAGEREALERYLRGIRERPETLAEEQDPGQEGDGRTPGGTAPRQGQERPGGEGEQRSQQGRSGESDGNRSGEQGGAQGEEQGASGQPGGEQEPQNPFAQAGTNENQEGEQQPGEGTQPGDGRPGEEQLEEGGDEQATGPGDSPANGEQQGQGQGAGALPSAEQEAGRAGQLGSETLQLRGDLRDGPLSEGGTIQLPGGDEVELPPGRTPETYAHEVESAVTEGRIPLEYQEIIRNYFR